MALIHVIRLDDRDHLRVLIEGLRFTLTRPDLPEQPRGCSSRAEAGFLDGTEARIMDGSDLPALPASDSSVPPPSGGGGADGAEGPARGREGCEALAGAIASTLGAVMREFDSRAEGVDRSQDELSTSLDRLARGKSCWANPWILLY